MDNSVLPLVSIRCFVYNQVKYVRQCLDGFVMQKTNFPFEAIVHDDASTDGSAEVIKEYAQKYPHIIKPIFETENLYSKHDGSLEKVMDAQMRGKYIAVCEGDDYWIDPLKLQKQVDFLESHPEFVCSCHRYNIYNELAKEMTLAPNKYFDNKKGKSEYFFDLKYPFQEDWITKTLTCVYRKSALDTSVLKQYKYARDVHWVYYILLKGQGVCHSFVGGVYRKNPYSVFGSQSRVKQIEISYKVYEEFYQITHDVMFKTLLMSLFVEYIRLTRRVRLPKNRIEWESLLIYMPRKIIQKVFKSRHAK